MFLSLSDTKDDGGPTKHFLDQVWQQLPALKVSVDNKKQALFEMSENIIIPIKDDILSMYLFCEKIFLIQGIVPNAGVHDRQ